MKSVVEKYSLFLQKDEKTKDPRLIIQYPFGVYAKAGIPFVIEQELRKERVSLLAVITDEKLTAYQMFKGSVIAGYQGSFLLEILNRNQDIRDNMKNQVFYMNNACIHLAKILKPFFQRINIFYWPPYSPFLNPIEQFFASVKGGVRKIKFHNRFGLLKNLHKVIQTTHKDIYESSFRNTLKYLIKSLKNELIL